MAYETLVGVIGGANGPTAVFVTGDLRTVITACTVLLFAVAAAVFLVIRKKK